MTARERQARRRSNGAAPLLIGVTVGALALPSAVLAFSSRFDPMPESVAEVQDAGFEPASVDPRLARSITVRALSKGRLFRFTPAATPSRTDRSVTVAVRLDPASTRPASTAAPVGQAPSLAALRLAPMGYSLGVSRGYKSFAQKPDASAGSKVDIPDLATFRPAAGPKGDPSRFSTRIALDGTDQAGSSPRTFSGQGDQKVDLGGSYRLTRNINVTAGVRYQSERDRLVPVTDGKQDNQAVYVGTQFRF